MMIYFLQQNERHAFLGLIMVTQDKYGEESNNDSTLNEDEDGLEDDMKSGDNNGGSPFNTLPDKLGNDVQHVWK
jgi:hypothetical protein